MRMVPMELDNLRPHTFKKSHKMTRVKARKQTLTILPLVQLIYMRTVTFCKYNMCRYINQNFNFIFKRIFTRESNSASFAISLYSLIIDI